jgi:hypothetical protein
MKKERSKTMYLGSCLSEGYFRTLARRLAMGGVDAVKGEGHPPPPTFRYILYLPQLKNEAPAKWLIRGSLSLKVSGISGLGLGSVVKDRCGLLF